MIAEGASGTHLCFADDRRSPHTNSILAPTSLTVTFHTLGEAIKFSLETLHWKRMITLSY